MTALLPLVLAQAMAVERSVRVRQALDVTPLDVAFLDAERLLVLSDEATFLYRVQGDRLMSLSRLGLPGAPVRARKAAGMLRVVVQDGVCWALSNRRAGASLLSVEGDRLAAVAGAEAIPPTAFAGRDAWPAGVRFFPGTNLLEVGETTLLRFAGDGNGVGTDGAILLDGEPDPAGRRAGDALAVLDAGLVAVSGPGPSDAPDEVRVIRRGEAEPMAAWPTAGPVRALAARAGSGAASLAVAFEAAQGAVLEIIDLRWNAR